MGVLVIDVGTTDVRASLVNSDGSVSCSHSVEMPSTSPAPGLSEFDPRGLADGVLAVATASLAQGRGAEAVAVTAQRASTVVWDRKSGDPVGSGIGWQDLRTVGTCLELQGQGIYLAPSQSATKLAYLLDEADPERTRDLCFGTVDSWVVWILSNGAHHVTDASNVAVTGLVTADAAQWDDAVLAALRIPRAALPRVVDSSGVIGPASALEGAPPIAGIVGDQQASLVGQGCTEVGQAKLTLGTGGMLDQCLGAQRPAFAAQGKAGTFPIVAWRIGGAITWGVEATMLSAGTCMEWLRDDLGLVASATQCDELAASIPDSGGVVFVPALFGLGTPDWDYGARGTLLGLSRGSGRAQIARAVLEGIAHRCADLLEATESDTGLPINQLHVDGGMSKSAFLMQAIADATQRDVAVCALSEATTVGVGFLAGVAVGLWPRLVEATRRARSKKLFGPKDTVDRDHWADALGRARRTIPELSTLEFTHD